MSPAVASRVRVPSCSGRPANAVPVAGLVQAGWPRRSRSRPARAAASDAAAAGRSRTGRRGQQAPSQAQARRAAQRGIEIGQPHGQAFRPGGWWTPVMPMIALRSASSGRATLIRPASRRRFAPGIFAAAAAAAGTQGRGSRSRLGSGVRSFGSPSSSSSPHRRRSRSVPPRLGGDVPGRPEAEQSRRRGPRCPRNQRQRRRAGRRPTGQAGPKPMRGLVVLHVVVRDHRDRRVA